MITLDALSQAIAERWKPAEVPTRRRPLRCACGRAISFVAQSCPDCAAPLGYAPSLRELATLEAVEGEDAFRVVGHDDHPVLVRCIRAEPAIACNWMCKSDQPRQLCIACRLNVEEPRLEDLEDDGGDWAAIEAAKRRLLAQLMSLDVPIVTRLEDPDHGLGFALRRPIPGGEPVLTGHAGGLITLNMDEANDARREQIRRDLHEPYRTLLGHFRHEIGHFFWGQLIAGSAWLLPFRELFGDERADYSEALARNYSEGPPSDWPAHHISPYASSHPWEDWAETWAHYLHVLDSLTTALAHGIDASDVEMTRPPFTEDDLYDPQHREAQTFLMFLNAWVEMMDVLNELNQSLGQPNAYPFELSSEVVRKLHFVHLVVLDARKIRAEKAAP